MTEVVVASVEMPERGVFLVRCPESFQWKDEIRGRRAVVALDYGLDVGEVMSAGVYDPAVHGPRMPGFRLERLLQDSDEARLAENDGLAAEMREAFVKGMGPDAHEARVCSVRLSFGRTRLFLRVACDHRRQDFSRATAEVKRLFGVSVNVWQLGPRDEVACVGALGVCGRVCCCASWQKRFPVRIAAPEGMNQAGANGVCGRYKCCWTFEQPQGE